jgi:hypothetical protein
MEPWKDNVLVRVLNLSGMFMICMLLTDCSHSGVERNPVRRKRLHRDMPHEWRSHSPRLETILIGLEESRRDQNHPAHTE